MIEIQSQAQIEAIKFMNNTHPEFRTTKRISLMRLREPKKFPYGNQGRLKDEVTEDVIEVFHELNSYIYFLPVPKRMEIFQSKSFNRFVEQEWLVTLQANDVQIAERKKKKEKEKSSKEKESDTKKRPEDTEANQDLSYQNYYNLFSIGITGIINAMPQEFQNHICKQLIPMMKLMQAIARFSGKDVPYIHYPEIFNEDTID